MLLSVVELIWASCLAVDELIDVIGRTNIEAVLQLSHAAEFSDILHISRALHFLAK
jgi:hypothetical protein